MLTFAIEKNKDCFSLIKNHFNSRLAKTVLYGVLRNCIKKIL